MPTYVVSASKGSLNNAQKGAIAVAISRVHAARTGAPSFFVQVVIDENEPGNRFLGGSVESQHIWIRADIRAGRTDAQRSALMLDVMREVAQIAGVKKEQVWIYLNNIAPTDMVEYGHVLPAPGKETEWFDSLPPALQDYLRRLGTSRDQFTL